MFNLHTKFEISMFIHYEEIEGNAKCRNCGGLGLGVIEGNRNGTPLIRAQ